MNTPNLNIKFKKIEKDPSKLFFTADSHFGHANIIKFEAGHHSFSTIEEHDETIIENWNRKVPEDGLVYHLGDFAFASKSKIRELVDQLNGDIVLLLGNHDYNIRGQVLNSFHSIEKDVYISVRDDEAKGEYQKISMFHYPQISWNGAFHGAWCLHGHTHQNCYENGKLLNVGLVNHNYEVLSYDEIKTIMLNKNNGINPAFETF